MAPKIKSKCALALILSTSSSIITSSAFQINHGKMSSAHRVGIESLTNLNALPSNTQNENKASFSKDLLSVGSSLFLSLAVMASSSPALAVSGGGLDFANLDISNQDFSNGNYKGKDFSQVIAKGATFTKSNLIGCRFFKAYLANTDFTGADLRGASLEDTSLDDAVLKDANLSGAYFSASLLDAKSIENADFTDAQLPPKLLERICEKKDFATGTNPATGEATRDTLMCP